MILKGAVVLKIIIMRGKSLVLWSQIAFSLRRKNEIYVHQIDDLPSQMTILETMIP